MIRYFTSKGYTASELLQVGLVTERQGSGAANSSSGAANSSSGATNSSSGATSGSGGIYDKFRHRVMFPIRDGTGRMTGFGGRILNPEDQPKFMNSPQTALFDKGRLLYALDQARKAIRAKDQVVIVEGYLDVIALHQCGFNNVVSPMGTALTEDQLRMLKRLTRRIVLALDPDAAGQKATLRGLEIARQSMDHTSELAFDARGLLRNEARLEADLRVTTLPEGLDPDEIVLRDAQEWARIVEAARPIVVHVMETLATGRDLDDPKVKSEIAAQVLPLVEDVPNSVEREAYRQRLARLLRVDERSLLGANPPARPVRRRPGGTTPAHPEPAPPPLQVGSRPEAALETHCLRLLLRQPDLLYMLDRILQKAGLSRLSVLDFEQVDRQMMAAVILQSLEQDDLDAGQYIQEKMPDALQDLARELLSPFAQGEPGTEKLVEDLIQTVMRLRQMRTRAHVDQLIFMQRDIQEVEGYTRLDDFQGIQNVMLQCSRVLKNLDKILGQPVQLD